MSGPTDAVGGPGPLGDPPPSRPGGLHLASPDPWPADIEPYEVAKRSHVLASLPARRFRSAFEPGCGSGELTVELADRSDRLLAVDADPTAVTAARQLLTGHGHVEVAHAVLPGDWPDQRFDLVVLCELLSSLTPDETEQVLDHVRRTLDPGGTLLCAHWRGTVPETGRSGDDVHRQLSAADGLILRRTATTPGYRLSLHDRWASRSSRRSSKVLSVRPAAVASE